MKLEELCARSRYHRVRAHLAAFSSNLTAAIYRFKYANGDPPVSISGIPFIPLLLPNQMLLIRHDQSAVGGGGEAGLGGVGELDTAFVERLEDA
jgi:hypothetical protein